MSADEAGVDPTEREPYDVLREFDYYAAMGATVFLSFEEIPDKSFQLGTQVTHDQIEEDSDGVIQVFFNSGAAQRCEFYPRTDEIYWKTSITADAEKAIDSRVILEVNRR